MGRDARQWILAGFCTLGLVTACEKDEMCSGGGGTCVCPDGTSGIVSGGDTCGGGRDMCVCPGEEGAPTAADAGPDAADTEPPDATPASDAQPDVVAIDAQPDARTGDVACGEQSSQAEIPESRPVDVIFIIDRSTSMSEELGAVERNINQNFAQIIEESGADYRVIMLTQHGNGTYQLCIEPPLASADCSVSGAGLPANGPRFFHESLNVQSGDSVCLMLENYGDGLTFGWGRWLRLGALKVFVEISDDQVRCDSDINPDWDFDRDTDWFDLPGIPEATVTARNVLAAIRELSTAQFGTAQEPNFVWHSLVGVQENDPVEVPYTHLDPPVVDGNCESAVNHAPIYQMMSISTGGLRYPVCAADQGYGFDAVFQAIAREVVRGSQVECAFDIPEAPEGKFVDYESVKVQYTPGGGGSVEELSLVGALADCDDAAFYYEGDEIKLCDAACERVRGDDQAQVGVVFQCGEEAEVPPVILQ